MLFEITRGDESIRVPGNNWLEALGGHLSEFGLDQSVLGRLVVDVGTDGVVQVKDPVSGSRFKLTPLENVDEVGLGHGTYETSASAGAPSAGGAGDAAQRGEAHVPPPPAEAESDRPEDLIDDLFDACFDIASAQDVGMASTQALAILRNQISCESAAVLYAGPNDTEMQFVAVQGPKSEDLRGRAIPCDAGIAGFVHRYAVGLLVADAGKDERHDKSVDESVGYTTNSILAVALRDGSGQTYGALELLNPKDAFREWHLEAAQVVAGSLADFMSYRY